MNARVTRLYTAAHNKLNRCVSERKVLLGYLANKACLVCGHVANEHTEAKVGYACPVRARRRYAPMISIVELRKDYIYRQLNLERKRLLKQTEERYKVKAEYKHDKLIFTDIQKPKPREEQRAPAVDYQKRSYDAYAWRQSGF